jgi:hypothetical protein
VDGHSASWVVVGTPHYMPPVLLLGRSMDERWDF